MSQKPDPNLGTELVRPTEAAAIEARKQIGLGNKIAADKSAVYGMRAFLNTVDFSGTVVIAEGEKDEAPMLYTGEVVGAGKGLKCDISLDLVHGTSLTARGVVMQSRLSQLPNAAR
ncbi:MAG: fructose 1,6-bisphosphatase [Actinomycetota bacterium]|jgi:fructose-1,6-bisphosphatase II